MTSTPFTITTVCTGNICRSPFAESSLRRRLDAWGVFVTSAGTEAADGRRVPDDALAVATDHGLDLSHHRSRPLTEAAITRSNLVLGLAREHRRASVVLRPRASRYTFTLIEFARLTSTVTADDLVPLHEIDTADTGARLSAAVDLLASHRGLLPLPSSAGELDIADPFGGSRDTYRSSARSIDAACAQIDAFFRQSLLA